MVSIWKFKSYKSYLKALVSAPNSPKGLVRTLAEAAQCLPSYLSQVLNAKAQLTPDHAHGIATYLNLEGLELEYWMTLVEFERASLSSYRNFLERKRADIEKKNQLLSKRLKESEDYAAKIAPYYYSHWAISAIHIMTSSEKYQTLGAISEKLKLPPQFVMDILRKLGQFGLIEPRNERWIYSTARNIYVGHESPFVSFHHRNWRQKAIEDSQGLKTEPLHFTGVYTISEQDFAKLREMVMNFIQQMNQAAGASPAEELVNLNLDLYWV